MEKSKLLKFEKAYRDGLEGHLERKPKGRTTSLAARKMGREALSIGLGSQNLVSSHFKATNALRLRDDFRGEKSSIAAEGIFLAEALRPIEKRKLDAKKRLQLDLAICERKLAQKIRHYDKLLRASQRQEGRTRALARQFLQAQEEERKEISRDLHDEVSQVLAGINVRLAALKKIFQLGGRDIDQRIEQTQQLVEQSVAAVHQYARRLRPSILDDLGLVPSLRSLIKNIIPARNGLNIRINTNSKVDFLNNEQRTALYRVAQEALTNVIRHAKAKNATINIRELSGRVRLKIRDNGKSFNVNRTLSKHTCKRLGLLGMRERIEMLDGTFSIVSTPELGTSIIAEIPIKSANPK